MIVDARWMDAPRSLAWGKHLLFRCSCGHIQKRGHLWTVRPDEAMKDKMNREVECTCCGARWRLALSLLTEAHCITACQNLREADRTRMRVRLLLDP